MSVKRSLTNHEIVTLAVYMLGGEFRQIDAEEIVVKANLLAPGRFTWRRYRDQINIENVRAFLSDAKKPKNGSYLIGGGKQGWFLTEQGVLFAKQHLARLPKSKDSRKTFSPKEKTWLRRERERMLASDAFVKFTRGLANQITEREAEAAKTFLTKCCRRVRQAKHPLLVSWKRVFSSGDVLLSHGLSPYYHRGCSVSLPCSEWERVGPLRYCHQRAGDHRRFLIAEF